MAKTVDTRLLMVAAQVARQWQSEDKEWIRKDFAKFVQPFWEKLYDWPGGVEYMMNKYDNNDGQSVVEYIYNLDHDNKEIVVKWLLTKVKGYPEDLWTVVIDEDK